MMSEFAWVVYAMTNALECRKGVDLCPRLGSRYGVSGSSSNKSLLLLVDPPHPKIGGDRLQSIGIVAMRLRHGVGARPCIL